MAFKADSEAKEQITVRKLRIMLWATVVLALIGTAGLMLGPRNDEPVAAASFQPSFALADAAGQKRTDEEFRGKHLLVFFGFTNCPDICPTTLAEVAQVMDGLGDEAAQVQPLFISIDPERDRQMGLSEFTEAFHPSILGLAGTAEETQAAAQSFKVFYEREDAAAAPDGYSMSHSSALYLIGPEGNWIRQYSYGTPASEILADLQTRL